MIVRYTFFILLLLLGLHTHIYSQSNNCNSVSAPDSSSYEGTAFFNYGTIAKSKSQKYQTAVAIGQNFVGFTENNSNSTYLGFYGRYLLPPFPLKVNATQGDLLDRIQITWTVDGLGPSPNEGFNIYRDDIFLATVNANIKNYNDFNVIAGVAYTYSVRGINAYGEGASSEALGFQVPNGVVTGWIRTKSGGPVPDAVVTLMPMQGFSTKFDAQDKAIAYPETSSSFISTNSDWTLTLWMKTDTAFQNADLLNYQRMSLFIKTINSVSGNEGIEVYNNALGAPIITAIFADSVKNDWNHISLAFENVSGLLKLYLNGHLIGQSLFDDTIIPGEEIFELGNNGIGGWEGNLDEVRIYNVLLNELDFPDVMNGTASSQTPGLTHYWKMDEELGEKSYDLKNRVKLFFCGADFDADRPPVRTAGKTNSQGYYTIESASYGTGTTFLAEPSKSFYFQKSVKLTRSQSSHISIPNFGLPQKSTVELWVNSAGASGIQTILSKKSNTNDFKVFLEPSGIDQILKISLNGDTEAFGILGSGFQHLAITIDSTSNLVNVYKNGTIIGSHTFSGVMGTLGEGTSPWLLGSYENGSALTDYFNGLIDEFAVYDTLLSSVQINDHFQKIRKIQEKGLCVYFPMNEGAGNRITNVGSKFLDSGNLINCGWSSFAPNQKTEPHEFAPKTRQVTLNPSVTSVDQVDFVDNSTVPVSGYVRYKDTDCFANNVEILVNNTRFNPPIFTDSTGRFVIDFDPGATVRLTPKLEDHVFIPAFWEVTNVNSPIAGILFNDQTIRKVSGQIAGGLCKKAIIESGEFAYIKVRSVDGCFEKLVEITNQEGNFEIDSLPPLERMTVAVIHDNPFIDKFFNDQGAPTVNLSIQDTTLQFIYFAQPQIEVVSGLEPFSPTCNVIVMDQYERKELVIKLKEQYVVTTSDDGVCYIDSASIRIINGFADTTEEAKISNGFLLYKYIVGKPNPTPPYLKTLQLISTTLEGNRGEYTTQGVVTGIFEKLPTFVTQLPETPTLVLHDPPGDGSYAFIEKGQKICEKITLSTESNIGRGIQTILDLAPDIKVPIFFGIPDVEFESEIGPTVTAVTTISKTSNNSMEVCKTFNQRFSTSEDDLIVGEQGGDLFVGAGLNINFGFANVIFFDSTICQPIDTLSAMIQPRQYGTTFMYSEYYIKNTVIPYLDTLSTKTTDSTEISRFLDSSLRWKNMLKNDSIRTANAKSFKNISFDAGIIYEYSETIDSLFSETEATNTDFNGSLDYTAIIKGNGVGGGYVLKAQIESISSNSKDNNNEKGVTTGYVLKDDDVLDAFSVDLAIDSVYKTPIFKVAAGQSSCPWEPNTAKREGVNLVCTNGPVRTDVPANEPATFTFILGNTSSTLETWTYAFTAGPESNPHGAKIFCNGAPMNQIQWYAIPYGTSIPVTVTVERGPLEYDYDGLEIVLYSGCEDQRANDLGILPDTASFLYSAVYVSAFFIRPCSEVVINEPEQNFVIFPDPLTSGTDIVKKVVVSGYNTDPKFKSLSLQHRRSNGDGTWIAFSGISEKYNPKWEGRAGIVGPYDTLSHRNYDFFDWNTLGFNDGDYEIRAVTNCTGDASDKPGYSEIIKGRIDRSPPALVGVPQPSDGVYHVGDEISFTFNQNINCQKFMQLQILGSTLIDVATDSVIGITRSCIDNKIVLTPDFENSEFENKILRAELHNIEDLVGNKNIYEQWEFYVDRNELALLEDTVSIVKYDDEVKSVKVNIHNRGGYPVPYTLQNIPPWMRVYPSSGTLVANETEEITIEVSDDVPLGNYFDSIILRTETGLNPFFMGGDEVLIINTRVICRPPVWVIDPATFDASPFNFSMNYILKLNIEGTLSTDTEDIVGAYVDGELRGVSKVQFKLGLGYVAFLTAYSNVTSGETVDFQIWDASDCQLYADIFESYPFVDNTIIGNTNTPQIIHTSGKLLRKIYIKKGWNWISFNLDPLDPAINGTLESLSDPVGATIKGQSSFSQYSTNLNIWAGSLTDLGPGKMYQYYSQVKDSISLIGTHIDSLPIPISQGWNWIGYMPTYKLPVNTALSTLQPSQGDIIKGQLTFAVYDTNLGWVGNLTFMNEPNGYLLKSTTTDTLIYPNLQTKNVQGGVDMARMVQKQEVEFQLKPDAENPSVSRPLHWELDPSQYEYTMNIIAYVVDNEDRILLKENDEIGLFVNDELRGNGRTIYIPAIDKYILFVTVYANKNGEQIDIKFYSAAQDKVFDIKEKMMFNVNDIIGAIDSPALLHLTENVSSTSEDFLDKKLKVYPNPFSSTVNIDWQGGLTGKTEIKVTNSLGELIHVFCCDHTMQETTFVWKPDNSLSAGTYIVQVITPQEVIQKKVIFIK
jgi:Concanavalin A-like lectin/glucanases superfamily/Secretion system C-terminal sorting domain